jgi:hypothetical protein
MRDNEREAKFVQEMRMFIIRDPTVIRQIMKIAAQRLLKR